MSLAALLQRLGMWEDRGAVISSGFAWNNRARPESLRPENIIPPERRADWVFGDLAAVSFRSEDELERLVERALQSPGWRSAMSGWMAGRIRERLTHEALVGEILELVGGGRER